MSRAHFGDGAWLPVSGGGYDGCRAGGEVNGSCENVLHTAQRHLAECIRGIDTGVVDTIQQCNTIK